MTNEDILKLVNAGYTKEEISAMETPNAETDEAAGKENQGAEQENAESAETVSAVNDKIFNDLLKSVNDLKDTVAQMQQSNIKDAKGGKADNKTISDVMQSFVDKL